VPDFYEDATLPPVIPRWLETYNNNNLDGHVALYTDDSSILIPAPGGACIDLDAHAGRPAWRSEHGTAFHAE
jgi:hypothetical protein